METRKSSFEDHMSIVDSGHSKTAEKTGNKEGDSLLQKIANELNIDEGKEQTKEAQEPKIEVGNPEGRQKKGTFKVSPEMMKRLQEKKSSKKDGS